MGKNKEDENKLGTDYQSEFIKKNVPEVLGTAATARTYSDELARIQEANRIQRQTAGASYAEMYERARGQSYRNRLAGGAAGITGGMAVQRGTEISGAEMRGLSQIAGQREQAMRDINYQDLMAPRQALEFTQHAQHLGREEQMFNLQMIHARQDILDSKMSDEDKIQALVNAGMDLESAKNSVDEAGKNIWERFKDGDMNALGLATGTFAAGVGGKAIYAKFFGKAAGLSIKAAVGAAALPVVLIAGAIGIGYWAWQKSRD